MKLSELYSEYFANWISDGGMINRDKISLLGIRPLFDRFLTNQYITKAWMVTAMPVHYDKNMTQMIRTEMYKQFPEVKTVVHLYNVPVKVRVYSDNFRRHMNVAATHYYRYRDVFESLSEVEQETGVVDRDASGAKVSIDAETLSAIQDSYDSYMYVHHAVGKGKTFTNTYYFVQASCKSKSIMAKYEKALVQMLRGDEIVVKSVRGNVGQYLDNFCPAAYVQNNVGKFRSMLFSQENIAALMPAVTMGLIGKRGIMAGINWQTKLPFRLDLTGSGAAQVVLIDGKSGCGKTYLSFVLTLELVGFNVHCSVTDIKGGEWSKLSEYVDTLEIDMSGDSARFVNLMRLDDLKCTNENCREAYDYAVSNTVGLFEVCTNLQENEGNEADLRSILGQAVEKVFSTVGVVKTNPQTFDKTKKLTYESVLDTITVLEYSKAYTEEQRRICKYVKSRCAPYFMGEGRYSTAFKNELTVADVLNTPLIIYNFNKNRGEALDIIDNIRVYMARCLDSRKHFMRKQKGLHQAVFYEELQRCGGMKQFVRNISADVTGSRSNNLTVFLLLNAVSTFDSEDFAAIRSNITTRFIGNSYGKDIVKLVNEYDCKPIERYMKLISENPDGNYSNCFAVLYDVGNDKDKLILKTVIPECMEHSFSTRDSIVIG